MQHISTAIREVTASAAPHQPSSASEKAVRTCSALWVRMTEIYGSKWTGQYGDRPLETWINGIADLTHAQIAEGLRRMVKHGSDWPPSLPTFRLFCRPQRENAAAYREAPLALPQKLSEESISKGRAALADCQAILRR